MHTKKIIVPGFVFVLILLSHLSPGQLMQFQQGKKYFSDGDYYKALEFFNQAISQERSGNAEMLSEAYYLRGLTHIRLHGEAFATDNKEDQKRFEDALLKAYKDFRSSLEYDEGLYWKQIDLEIKNLHHSLLQEGLQSLNQYNELVFKGKTDPKLLKRAEDYLTATHEIRDTYLVNDLLGQVYLDKGQKEEAKIHFSRSEQLYTAQLPEEPDFLMAYVFYRLAAIHKTDSIRIAMQDAQRGLNLMESEYGRYQAMKGRLSPVRVQQMEDQYRLAMQDLNNLKLDLYLSSQDLYVEAVHVFEEQLLADPANVDLLVGYASLLEKSDKKKSMETYSKVLEIDPRHQLALFNLGALHYTRGRELFELAQQEENSQQYKILSEEALVDFETARPYFERALEVNPASLEAIQALKTIAYILDDQPAYLKYDEMEKAMNN